MPGLDSELIQYAIDTARERGFKQVNIRLGDSSFSATLSAEPGTEPAEEADDASSEPSVVEQLSVEPIETNIEAPAVGYFRAVEPALTQGQILSAGDKVGEVVALGLANDVNTSIDGEILEVCVEDGEPVEYGQPILLLRQKL